MPELSRLPHVAPAAKDPWQNFRFETFNPRGSGREATVLDDFWTRLLLAGSAAAQNLCRECRINTKKQIETVDSSHYTYAIDMGGKIDGPMARDPIDYWAYDRGWGPNIRVTMENIGDMPVINPWLQRAGTMDTRTLQSIVDSIVKPGMSRWWKNSYRKGNRN